MNHYFSRLAQRSGIAVINPRQQSQVVNTNSANIDVANDSATNAKRTINQQSSIDAWGEQNTEMVSRDYHIETKQEKSDQLTHAAINHTPLAQSSITPSANTQVVSTPVDNTGINSTQLTASGLQPGLTQAQLFSTDVHSDTVDTFTNISTNLPATISYPEHKNVPSLPGSSSVSAAGMQRDDVDNFPEKNIVTEQRQNITASTELHRKTIVADSVQRNGNTIAMDNRNTQGFDNRSVIEGSANKKNTARPDSEVQSTSMVAPAHRAGRAASNSVAATPGEIPTALINRPDAWARSGVQVNIGKVELEIFAPQKQVVQAPPPVAPVVKPARPEPAFNPHRHYLRSR